MAVGAPTECWPFKGTVGKDGYGRFVAGRRMITASRAAWILTHGNIARDKVVCHSCDNPVCCNPSHLFIGTQADNMRDAMLKGRVRAGVRHPWSKLTEAQVLEIRALGGQRSLASIARDFNITARGVAAIISGRTWRALQDGVA